MKKIGHKLQIAALSLSIACFGSAAYADTANSDQTTENYTLSLVQGPNKPEDLVAIPESPWVMISSMAEERNMPGSLYAIHQKTHELINLFPDTVKWADDPAYKDCPGRPDLNVASPHGINIRARKNGVHQLLVVNHGGRESIEVFTLTMGTTSDIAPELSWVGCIPMPSGVVANGVAPTPDGGLVATKMFDSSLPDGEAAMLSGKISGYIVHWTPQKGWRKVAGTDMSAPNGIEVSSDGKTIIVASWTGRKIHRFPLEEGTDVTSASIDVDFMPDNVRKGTDGRLLVTGQKSIPQNLFSCVKDGLNCSKSFTVVEVDVDSMEAKIVFDEDTPNFHAPTVALGLADQIWVGTLVGSSIGRLAVDK